MTIHILYPHYFDRNGKKMSVGGIQTYITALSKVFVENGYKVIIYQSADVEFHREYNSVNIFGYKMSSADAEKLLIKKCKEKIKKADVVIFGTDLMASKVEIPSIAIQHGISWDVPDYKGLFCLKYLKKVYKAWKRIQLINRVDALVCVDYNFINWVRAITPFCKVKMTAIPNFTKIPENKAEKKNDSINIIFARRFFWYRGTRIFAEAIENVLKKRRNIVITIAGEGEDEEFLKNKLSKYSNVIFTKYSAQESLEMHSDKHIAVVPTLGSEGTSLSLLEAMASNCAVICTNVGGMTNIILNEYNGIMISPNAKELENSILRLIDNPELRAILSNNAYCTARDAFSIDKWSERWLNLVESIVKNSRESKM